MLLRRELHRQLAREGWSGPGISPVNQALCALILIGGVIAVLETERVLLDAAEHIFAGLDLLLFTVFTVEYIARLYAAGEDPRYSGILGRLRYAVTPVAVIDLLAVLPFYVNVLPANTLAPRLFRLLAILRFAKLGRHSLALTYMAEAVRMRRYELGLSAAIGGFVMIFSATLLYLAEGGAQPESFGSIPRALWWSIMTLTTVGYGDVYPVTPLGQTLAGLTAVMGIGLIAMPTGILAAAFSEVFQKHRASQVAKSSNPAKDIP